MRTLKLVAVGLFLVVSSVAEAQVSLNVNIGSRPVWAPVQRNVAVDFYYVPDVHAYYDTRASMYVYQNGNNWVRSRDLPTQYRNVNINNCQTVALSGYRGYRPYEHYSNHRAPQRVVYVENNRYDDHDHYDRHDYNKKHDKKYDKKYNKRH
ncbi:hypothetical protein FFWV33_12230 [Flavobacterium faecale]|uniref:Uncharacterized protein n=1 Tax=Flavobacterium faecale TaxID=1355330 RepID=A0A2S1LEV7_9FLAO|nr:hypothetical protein [Flavobacterium faecale]AWG22229.1 hypothetical protein FFWV33_12230 [Flavobacterium faecale]